MTITEEQKESMYKWRADNTERYREICKKGSQKFYEKNKEKVRQRALEYYYRKKAEKLLKEAELKLNEDQQKEE